MEPEISFGAWLEKRRKALDLTREVLARRAGCSVSALRKIETDERRPSKQLAAILADCLEIPEQDRPGFLKIARRERQLEQLHAPLPLPPLPAVRQELPPRASTRLPAPPTPLVGREQELRALAQMLKEPQCRIVTLVGPGGIGKTRLALEAGSRLEGAFPHGVYFVPLAPTSSARFVVPVIANSISFTFQSAHPADPKTQLLNYLKEKRTLLLLDNLEQLLNEQGVPELVAELLQQSPGSKLLATSREPLNVQGEWVFEVRGLPIPENEDMKGTSAELFLQAARRTDVGFDPAPDDYPAILRICQLMDGMPLGMELAAAWVRTLSCAEIAAEIEHGLDFLSLSARDMPARHRSMRAVFDHSWELLTGEERSVLARLSIFQGDFQREAAQQVAGAALSTLSALVAKSLVRRSGRERYNLHGLIRQYAALHLGADPAAVAAARQQHYTYYLALAEAAAPHLKGSSQMEWLGRLEQERDNWRAALEWSLAEPDDSALRLACALRWFWLMRGFFHEGRGWLMKALQQERPQTSPPLHRLALSDAAIFYGDQRVYGCALEGLALLTDSLGHHRDAILLAEHSAEIYRKLGDKQGQADALMVLGQSLRWQGKESQANARLEQSLRLYREVGDRWNIARSLYRLGDNLSDLGGNALGHAMLEESSSILEQLGDKFILVGLLNSRGLVAVNSGDYALARSHFERALDIAREIRDPWGMANALTNIGCILRIQADYPSARSRFEEALGIYEQWGRGAWCTDPLCALAENEISQGNLPAASVHLREAQSYAEPSGNRWLQVLVGYFEGLLAYYEGEMERAAAALEKVTALARESQYKPDLARALVTLGRVMRTWGKSERAAPLLGEGLGLFYESGSRLGIAAALEVYAGLVAPDSAGRSAALFGSAAAIRSAIGAPLPPVDHPAYEGDIAAVRTQLGEAAFAKAWSHGQAEPYQAVVAGILGL
jgi:predicted ATPase/transcriptional regulator with XRE-family HTH domain